MQQQSFQQQHSGEGVDASAEPGAGRGSPSYEPMKGADGAANAQLDGESKTNETGAGANDAGAGDHSAVQNGEGVAPSQEGAEAMDPEGKHAASRIGGAFASDVKHCVVPGDQRADDDQAANTTQIEQAGFEPVQTGRDFYDDQDPSFGYNDQSGFGNGFTAPQQPVAPPVNAPTGPKAMRQGLPNSGFYSRPQPSQTPSTTNAKINGDQQSAANGQGSVRGRSADRSGYDDDRDRDNDRSRSRHRSKKHDRSRDDDYESDATYERRKERERRKRKERERRYEEEDREVGRSKSGKVRSRTASPGDESSHRHHRDRDDKRSSRRDRSRDKRSRRDDDDDSSRKKLKSHRSRDGEDDYDRERDKDKSSRRDRGSRRDYEDERKDRSSKHSRHTSRDRERSDRKHSTATVDAPSDDIGFKIKGSHSSKINPRGMPPPSRRNDSRRPSDTPAAAPKEDLDPYAAERERHKQERALREQQRRLSTHGQGSSSQGLGKRGRDETEESGSGKKRRSQGGRRISAKYEGEIDAGSGERERERERWR